MKPETVIERIKEWLKNPRICQITINKKPGNINVVDSIKPELYFRSEDDLKDNDFK